MKTKVCKKCGKEKPATTEFFHKSKDYQFGVLRICRLCRNLERAKYKHQTVETTCRYCQKIFKQTPAFQESFKKYCSPECRHNFISKKSRGYITNDVYLPLIKHCKQCGERFEYRLVTKQFCSKHCRGEYQKKYKKNHSDYGRNILCDAYIRGTIRKHNPELQGLWLSPHLIETKRGLIKLKRAINEKQRTIKSR